MIVYKDHIICITNPFRQHRNATALMQVRKNGVTLKSIRYKANYPSEYECALEKAEIYIDKLLF